MITLWVWHSCALRLCLTTPLIVTVICVTHPHDCFAAPVVACTLIECEVINDMENESYLQSAWFKVLDMWFYDHEHLTVIIQSNKVHKCRSTLATCLDIC